MVMVLASVSCVVSITYSRLNCPIKFRKQYQKSMDFGKKINLTQFD